LRKISAYFIINLRKKFCKLAGSLNQSWRV